MEPTQLSLSVNAILWIVIPFASYYIGILIHWRFLTDRKKETLKRNCAFGIPTCLFVVLTYIIIYLEKYFPVINLTYGITIAILIFNGMAVQETSRQLMSRYSKPPDGPSQGNGS